LHSILHRNVERLLPGFEPGPGRWPPGPLANSLRNPSDMVGDRRASATLPQIAARIWCKCTRWRGASEDFLRCAPRGGVPKGSTKRGEWSWTEVDPSMDPCGPNGPNPLFPPELLKPQADNSAGQQWTHPWTQMDPSVAPCGPNRGPVFRFFDRSLEPLSTYEADAASDRARFPRGGSWVKRTERCRANAFGVRSRVSWGRETRRLRGA
jgi:hypothetical protein